MTQAYRSQILDHRGLVGGMFDELGIGAVIDHVTHAHAWAMASGPEPHRNA